MRDNFRSQTLAFVEQIKESDLYKEYASYKKYLDSNEELRAKVDDFRRKSFEVQIGHKYGYFNAYENLLRLNQEHEELLEEPLVQSFLEAELKLSRSINEILSLIADEIDLDLNFLEG